MSCFSNKFHITDNVCMLCLPCNVKHSPKQQFNCLKIGETSVVLIVFSVVHFEVCAKWPSWLWSYGSWIYNQCLSLLMLWIPISIRERCTILHFVCDKVCQWLATGRWFSPGPLVPSTHKTDRHDITEILLRVP